MINLPLKYIKAQLEFAKGGRLHAKVLERA